LDRRIEELESPDESRAIAEVQARLTKIVEALERAGDNDASARAHLTSLAKRIEELLHDEERTAFRCNRLIDLSDQVEELLATEIRTRRSNGIERDPVRVQPPAHPSRPRIATTISRVANWVVSALHPIRAADSISGTVYDRWLDG
jgi:hypothetical protein